MDGAEAPLPSIGGTILHETVFNLTVAGVPLPLGMLMFTTCSITSVRIADFIGVRAPFYLVLFGMLFVFTYVPQLSLWLPNPKFD